MQSPMSRSATGIAILFTLLAIIQTTFTTGTMTVVSHCTYPVWMQFVTQSPGDPPWELIPSTGYTFPWSQYPMINATDCDGISIKLGLQNFDGQLITQVEVAWNSILGQVSYDVSDLDANGPSPFYEQGYLMWANEAATTELPMCQTIHCGAGENPCTDVYWFGEPKDAQGESLISHVYTCADSADLHFEICTG